MVIVEEMERAIMFMSNAKYFSCFLRIFPSKMGGGGERGLLYLNNGEMAYTM